MELTKKTTILLSPELHKRLSRLARSKGVSLGELIRTACSAQYGVIPTEERIAAVAALAGLSLPVGDVEDMERESVPSAE
jgi:predicted transcriptional regulator